MSFSVRPRIIFNFLKFAIPLSLGIIYFVHHFFEPHFHLDLVFYNRDWINEDILPVLSLAGCFEPERISSSYNITESIYGKKRYEVQAGLPMRMGMDCYEFAGTVKDTVDHSSDNTYIPPDQRVQYHTYWRNDLAPLGVRQEWMLKSFFATQNVPNSRLIMWSNGDLSANPILQKYQRLFPDSFELRIVDIPDLARGTAMEHSKLLRLNDPKAWVDGDLVRLLVIYAFGGVWLDMDLLLTRSVEPLLEHEFVTQWDCYDKTYQALNGALMHFRQQSPYLCEAFDIMANSKPPRSPSTDWGAILYLKLWRRLVASSIPPFKVLPFCFSDGLACTPGNRLPDPFVPDRSDHKWALGLNVLEGGGLQDVLGKVFSVHLHNRWEKQFPTGGWVDRLLLRKYDEKLREMEKLS